MSDIKDNEKDVLNKGYQELLEENLVHLSEMKGFMLRKFKDARAGYGLGDVGAAAESIAKVIEVETQLKEKQHTL